MGIQLECDCLFFYGTTYTIQNTQNGWRFLHEVKANVRFQRASLFDFSESIHIHTHVRTLASWLVFWDWLFSLCQPTWKIISSISLFCQTVSCAHIFIRRKSLLDPRLNSSWLHGRLNSKHELHFSFFQSWKSLYFLMEVTMWAAF